MTLNASSINIVQWYGISSHVCGYCKSDDNTSNGLVAHTMQPRAYQELIDRGWRRSGTYCYKPVMQITCCPMYTIRNDTLNFSLSKSQKKVLKRFSKYLSDGILPKSAENRSDEAVSDSLAMFQNIPEANQADFKLGKNNDLFKVICDNISVELGEGTVEQAQLQCIASTSKSSPINKIVSKGIGADPNKPVCKKAKLLRLEKKQQKLLQQGKLLENPLKKVSANTAKPLEDFFQVGCESTEHKLGIRTLSSETLTDEQLEAEHVIFAKYQMAIHNDTPNKCKMSDFKRFLVDTPLIDVDIPDNPIIANYGSYHQQYWIDNKLIAVGVIDILPGCVSSVYFFYDPDYKDLTLGTYATLREIAFVKSLARYTPALRYYYMGYYIHSCTKMRYKGQFKPSELACPETYRWQPIERCRQLLDKVRYSRLDNDVEATDENSCDKEDIEGIKVLRSNHTYTTAKYSGKFGTNRKMFETIGLTVGKKTIADMLVCLYEP